MELCKAWSPDQKDGCVHNVTAEEPGLGLPAADEAALLPPGDPGVASPLPRPGQGELEGGEKDMELLCLQESKFVLASPSTLPLSAVT